MKTEKDKTPNEASEEWTQYRQDQQKRRAKRLPGRQNEIEQLSELGYKVEKKSDYHYRINDAIDVYPIHNRYHILKTNKRGGCKSIAEFIKNKLKTNDKC